MRETDLRLAEDIAAAAAVATRKALDRCRALTVRNGILRAKSHSALALSLELLDGIDVYL